MGRNQHPDEKKGVIFNPKLKPENLILIRINLVKTSIKQKSYGPSLLTKTGSRTFIHQYPCKMLISASNIDVTLASTAIAL